MNEAGEGCCCNQCHKNIRLDLYTGPCKGPVIWGIVYDECGEPLPDCPVQLISCGDNKSRSARIIIQTYSDWRGRYEIQLPSPCNEHYRVMVGNQVPAQPSVKRMNYICYY